MVTTPAPPVRQRTPPVPLAGAVARPGRRSWPGAAVPLTWLLAGYPIWWALGLGVLIFPLMAVPMAVGLVNRRPLRLPPELGLWFLFLLTALAGIAALGMDPAGTIPDGVVGRLPGVAFRFVEYGSLTVLMLYAGNLTERELPRRRLVGLLAWLFVVTVGGGLLGTFAGDFQFSSPVEMVLPPHLRGNGFVASLVHPSAAQVMEVLGYSSPRPAAPWGYTNTWGNNFALLIGWFVVAALAVRRRVVTSRTVPGVPGRGTVPTGGTTRWLVALAVLLVALVPAVFSLNRGLWIDLGLGGAFVAFRLASRGRLWALATAAGAVTLVGVLLVLTPLGTVVSSRLENGKSNNVRMYVTQQAVTGIWESPVVGLGTTRNTAGSDQSIAVGGTADCARCGAHTIGGNGQLWQVLYLHGLLGTACYLGFFLTILWRYRSDTSAIGLAGSAAIVISLASMLYYNALVTPLAFTFLSYVLLWRNSEPEESR
ncbi:MAG: hypothetical protein WCA46_00160 [Actinocatenispora sp.]